MLTPLWWLFVVDCGWQPPLMQLNAVKTCTVMWHWLQRELWCGSGKRLSCVVAGLKPFGVQLVVLVWHVNAPEPVQVIG